jgi:predicted protein tyrosine phosphatase
MIEIYPNPYHCLAVTHSPLGTVPPDHLEHLVARRGNRLMLNPVDSRNPADIPKEAIDAALDFVHRCLQEGRPVLVHCGFRVSRSAAIGLLYLVAYTDVLPRVSLAEADEAHRRIYPLYSPCRRDQGVYGGAPGRLCRKGATT